jgi:acyl-CoA thioesterase-1
MKTLFVFLLANMLSLPFQAAADEVQIVAFGASQTHGKGVDRSDAYPAQLEKIMKAEGYSVTVINEGIDGNTTGNLLNRLDGAVPRGAKVVILQPGTNDTISNARRASISPDETRENVEKMLAILKNRNVRTILLGYPYPGTDGPQLCEKYSAVWYGSPRQGISEDMVSDGQHFTKEGYAVLAQKLSLLVRELIDKSGN